MPIYSFKCSACSHSFEQSMTVAERESVAVRCPSCGSDKVERVLSAFFAKTSRKS